MHSPEQSNELPVSPDLSKAHTEVRRGPWHETPIHGVDYLCDYYALLGVERAATTEQIRTAYRTLVRQYHSDNFHNAAPELKNHANRKFNLLTEAHGVLEDAEKRASYDKQLSEFDPRAISNDGTPILNLGKRRICIDMLASGEQLEGAQQRRERARLMSGYSESTLEIVENLFKQTEKPSDSLRNSYRDQLTQKLVYENLLVNFVWEESGVLNQSVPGFSFGPEDIVVHYKNAIADIRSEIPEIAKMRVLQIGTSNQPLLLGNGGEVVTGIPTPAEASAVVERVTHHSLATFNDRINELENVLADLKKTVESLLTHCTYSEYLAKSDPLKSKVLIVLEQRGTIMSSLHYAVEGESLNLEPKDHFKGLTVEQLKSTESQQVVTQLVNEGFDVILLRRNTELDFVMEATHVAMKHIEAASSDSIELERKR